MSERETSAGHPQRPLTRQIFGCLFALALLAAGAVALGVWLALNSQ